MNTTELNWYKSSYSSGEGGACVEVATAPATIRIRDSKVTDGPHLAVTPATWSAFLAHPALLPLD
ncbi:DUF397 domain-containing protein [Streptomyces sp. NBC_00879]|uniref:DUF397 domain-containing protein n=1 Tax=unclassified Streptomyces TaxID=2593676 RepID=UPI00386A7B13|nr:DUF397 domain-containing protein [Streptomyces sp. NBC_00885]WSY76421.1 DUF397 domain-containing protein [Streptomyces sp. NBC_00879]